MGWNRDRDFDIERRLRDERPQPSDTFIRSLMERAPGRRARRPVAGRFALVGALTIILAASLGAAGAIGSARSSVQSFGTSVYRLVQPSPSSRTTQQPAGGQASSSHTGNDPGSYTGGTVRGLSPFHHQYGGRYPICWQGHIIFVQIWQLPFYFAHGAHAARYCFTHH